MFRRNVYHFRISSLKTREHRNDAVRNDVEARRCFHRARFKRSLDGEFFESPWRNNQTVTVQFEAHKTRHSTALQNALPMIVITLTLTTGLFLPTYVSTFSDLTLSFAGFVATFRLDTSSYVRRPLFLIDLIDPRTISVLSANVNLG